MSDEGAERGEGGEDTVTRLLDMVVQEVSLVDRAANKHRFLIVKRDEAMAKARGKAKDPNDEESTGEEEETESGDTPPKKKPKPPFPPKKKAAKKPPESDPDLPDEEEEGEEDKPTPPRGRRRGAKKEAPDPMSALGLTLATLDKLASAVEEIEGDEDTDDVAYADLARDLRKASAAIAKAAGVELEEEEDDETDAERSRSASAKPSDTTSGVLSTVRDMLARLEGALAPTATGGAGAETGAAEAGAGAEVVKALRGIASAVKAIDTSVKSQSARLATLEKRTGLPNSQQLERSPRRREVSWPLDINHPLDRKSVNKDLSFHDDD